MSDSHSRFERNRGSLHAFPSELLLKTATAIVYVYDVQNTRNVFQNHRLGMVLGYPEADWQDQTREWQSYIHPDDGLKFSEHLIRLKSITEKQSASWDYRLRDAVGSWRWFISHDTLLANDSDHRPHYVVGTATEITAQKQAEEQKQVLFHEMRHRAKNFAAVIDAIARQMRPTVHPEAVAALDSFAGRLCALLSAGDSVLSSADRVADFRTVATETLVPFSVGERVLMIGDALTISEATAGTLALALYELATNALKYGALSTSGGSVRLRWWRDGAGASIEWKERGGPRVMPPTREGFGTRLIKSAVAQDRLANVALNYEPDGLRCRFSFEPQN